MHLPGLLDRTMLMVRPSSNFIIKKDEKSVNFQQAAFLPIHFPAVLFTPLQGFRAHSKGRVFKLKGNFGIE